MNGVGRRVNRPAPGPLLRGGFLGSVASGVAILARLRGADVHALLVIPEDRLVAAVGAACATKPMTQAAQDSTHLWIESTLKGNTPTAFAHRAASSTQSGTSVHPCEPMSVTGGDPASR